MVGEATNCSFTHFYDEFEWISVITECKNEFVVKIRIQLYYSGRNEVVDTLILSTLGIIKYCILMKWSNRGYTC